MSTKSKTLYITQTAVMLALLIVVQWATSPIPKPVGQFVTGSLVNLILLTSLFMIGLGGGLAIAVVSPFLAFLLGIGPAFIQVVPFVAVANGAFVAMALLVREHVGKPGVKQQVTTAGGLIAACAVKVVVLWVGLTIIALPLLNLPKGPSKLIGAMFTWPQIVTSLIGSALAMLVVPLLKRAMPAKQS